MKTYFPFGQTSWHYGYDSIAVTTIIGILSLAIMVLNIVFFWCTKLHKFFTLHYEMGGNVDTQSKVCSYVYSTHAIVYTKKALYCHCHLICHHNNGLYNAHKNIVYFPLWITLASMQCTSFIFFISFTYLFTSYQHWRFFYHEFFL